MRETSRALRAGREAGTAADPATAAEPARRRRDARGASRRQRLRRLLHWRPYRLLLHTARAWSEDNCASRSAALAFYTAFSLAPVLMIATAIAGFFFERDVVTQTLLSQAAGFLGTQGAAVVAGVLNAAAQEKLSGIAAMAAVITLVLGATTAFAEVKDDLDAIWRVTPRRSSIGLRGLLRTRLRSFALVLSIAFLLMAALLANAGLSGFSGFFKARLGDDVTLLAKLVSGAVSFVGVGLLFAAIYRVLPTVAPPWRSIWQGALVTTVLFVLGRLAIGLYLGSSAPGTVFGAAGSFAVLLLWVYYSAMIFFFGAELTRELSGFDRRQRVADADLGDPRLRARLLFPPAPRRTRR